MRKKLRKLLDYVSILVKAGILRSLPASFHMLEIQPTSCNIMITNRCNLRCMMCRQWKETPGEEMSTYDWKRVINDLRENGIKNLHFTGGEPLLRKDLPELVGYANEKGFTVGLTTNGILLTEALMERLIGAGLRSIVISIDALESSYDGVRGVPNAFSRVKESTHTISEAKRKTGIDASINFTLMKATIDEFAGVKSFADSLGLPVNICLLDDTSFLFKVTENGKDFWISDESDFIKLRGILSNVKNEAVKDYIYNYFKDPLQKHIPCASSQDRVVISPYGDFFGGCMSMGTFGNMKNSPFGVLRKDARYMKAKRNMFYKNCPGCSCGYLFNIKCLPGLIMKDLAQGIVCRTKN